MEVNNITGFHSKYTDPDKKITAQQYLAERMLERQAAQERLTLGYKFWNQPKWKSAFAQQLKHASLLLKTYSVATVLAALKSLPYHYSLANPKVKQACKIQHNKAVEPRQSEIACESSGVSRVEVFSNKSNLFSKLKGL